MLRYIGITSDLLRRQAQHGERLANFVQLSLPRMNYATAKGVEQFLIGAAKNMNVTLANVRNSVSPNSTYYLDSFRRGCRRCNAMVGHDAKPSSTWRMVPNEP